MALPMPSGSPDVWRQLLAFRQLLERQRQAPPSLPASLFHPVYTSDVDLRAPLEAVHPPVASMAAVERPRSASARDVDPAQLDWVMRRLADEGEPSPIQMAALSERCKEVKKQCIEKCSDATLGTGRLDGFPFFQCVNQCMDDNDCGNNPPSGSERAPREVPPWRRDPPEWLPPWFPKGRRRR